MDGEGGFGAIMQEAVKLKTAQMADKRRIYDKWPNFVQHTLFFGEKEDFREKRALPLPERLEAAMVLKRQGNELFGKKEYRDAIDIYERAGGLLYYVISTDPEWRNNKRGIDDDILVLKDCIVEEKLDDENKRKVIDFRISCYLNVAACKLKLREFKEARIACDTVLELDNSNVKALFRRAQAVVTPIGAGGWEMDTAIADLQTAAHIDPLHSEVRSLLSRLKEERTIQRNKDRTQYDGLFTRGTVCKDEKNENNEKDEEVNDGTQNVSDADLEKYKSRIASMSESDSLEQRIQDAYMLRDLYRRNGKEEEAKKLQGQIFEAKRAMKEGGRKKAEPVDFSAPDEQMIQDAKKYGIDLTDPMVQEELQRLEKKKERGEPLESPRNATKDAKGGFNMKAFWAFLSIGIVYRFVLPMLWEAPEEEF